MPSMIVDQNGTELSYIDSGAPPAPAFASNYVTIFMVHGSVFTSPVFQKVMSLAPKYGLRIVAINRRDHPGSTPFSPAELQVLASGTDEEKGSFVRARGLELATFTDNFIKQNNLPPISEDGKGGGIALLGWSLGSTVTLACVANIDSLPAEVQSRFKLYLRAHILQEPPSVALGTALPPKSWSPQVDTTIPPEARDPVFTRWITAYFTHGDLSTRDPDVLEYVVPATFRAPSIYNMSAEQITQIVYERVASTTDLSIMIGLGPHPLATYRKACFDRTIREKVPKMNVWVCTGDVTASFSPPAFWDLQKDNEANGGGLVTFKVIKGVNHFMHWDEPEIAIKNYLEALA
ncbi:hypothetical protein AcW1_003230 [Taiwanofungus camphoratus]|nr:hypothetical protein AcW1_003230 [Antrodia cinnamomea]